MRRAAERGRAVLVNVKIPHHAKKASVVVAMHARRAHSATLGKAHGHLSAKVPAYANWHGWKHHKHVHHGVVAAVLVAATLNIMLYRSAFALSDITQLWDFSSQSDYTLSDANALEYNGNSVRLKAQNYTSDANTMALYHLDEGTGSSLADSSSNNNTISLANTIWGSGNLNDALAFNSTTSTASAADSSSLSLSQSNTLEGWTKFGSSFSANSQSADQPIIDKGSYKLYYDRETGKPTYELENGASTTWTKQAGDQVNNSWGIGPSSAKSSVVVGSNMYVGTSSPTQVWQYNGTTWAKIGGDSVNSSWLASTYEEVSSLATDGTNLYAGLGTGAGDAEVWRYNGSSWTKIGGDAINTSWAVNTYEYVHSLSFYGGNLYAGLGFSTNEAEVWRWNGSSWSQIGGDGLNSGWTGSQQVKTLTNDGTNLYAGISIVGSAGGADVWRWNGSSWSQIGGDGFNSGWAASTFNEVMSMFYQGGSLYAGLGTSTAGTFHAEVWRYTGSTWTKLAASGIGFTASAYEGVASLSGDGTNIYAGLSLSQGDADVWRYNGSTWTQIGGDGLNSGWTLGYYNFTMAWYNSKLYVDATQASTGDVFFSWNGTAWSREGGQNFNGSWGCYNISSVRAMTTSNGKLYAGLGTNSNCPSVYEFDGSSWRLIGAPGLNSGWGTSGYSTVSSMTSMGGELYVGLTGSQNSDGEVWKWNGSTWSQVGGDGLNSGWNSVYLAVSSLVAKDGVLYAGVGSTGNNGEVWRLQSGSWSRIGGAGLNGSWNNTYRYISALGIYKGDIVAGGTGSLAGSNDVWKWNGSSWTQIGGDSTNSSWNFSVIGNGLVSALVSHGGKLYASIGSLTVGDASVWEYNGSSWTKAGGDLVNGSWSANTYDAALSLSSYNGSLYAGLGSLAGNGEVWKYSGSSWTQMGGDGLNSGWANTIEATRALQVYKGKLYAGLGDSQNADALVYSYGNNGYLQAGTNTFDTGWHHLVATYDGATMRLYVDGVLDGAASAALSIPDTSTNLLVGQNYGASGSGQGQSVLNGSLDEVRISNIVRPNFTTTPYTTNRVGVRLAQPAYTSGIATWDGLASSFSADGGSVLFRLSIDGGLSWKYWNSSAWQTSSGLDQASTITDVNTNIPSLEVGSGGIMWQAVLQGDGNQRPSISSATLTATADSTAPNQNAANTIMKKSPSGDNVAENGWTNAATPYFSWDAAVDTQSPIAAYCLYLGQSDTEDPLTAKGLLGASPIDLSSTCPFAVPVSNIDLATEGLMANPLTGSSSPYYLNIKAVDGAGNVVPASEQFSFRYDGTAPSNPLFVSTPSQFVSNKQVAITWPTASGDAAADSQSGVVGLQYRIGAGGTWYGDDHSGSQASDDLLANDGSYQTIDPTDFDALQDGNNTIYFRTWDAAGNVSSAYVTGVIKINTSSPSVPQNLTATPSTNTINSFAFDWLAPASFGGSAANLTYCYTINTLPSVNTCSYTAAGVTNLISGAYATQPGANTVYVVAKDEAGNINYATYASATFTANTAAPGLPLNTDIADISVKATSNWKLAISWEEPTEVGAGVAQYRVLRSVNDITYSQVASTSGTSYVDTGLDPIQYYYKVQACDSANNCGALTLKVDEKPTGKFTSAAALVSEPVVSDLSTRRATISWSTDRNSDSRIQFGKSTGNYFATEVASSEQTTSHSITINNLTSGTTYYARARWTDEDGNLGSSDEFVFSTTPAPTIKEVNNKQVGLGTATIQFTSKEATRVKVLYGKSESFGGSQEVNTAVQESTYTTVLSNLEDGTKYYYKLNTYDSEDNEYEGNVYSLTTPARPRISNLRFEPVEGEPTSTQRVTWSTNVPATTEVSYGAQGQAPLERLDSQLTTDHSIVIEGLADDSIYSLVARSRDGQGNAAVSETQTFRTALDTRPPKVSSVVVKSAVRGSGADARGQVIVSWQTDEPATSQVAFSQGSLGTELASRTAEDAKLVTDHLVIVSDLTPSKVYQVQALSKDRSSNQAKSLDQTTIVGKAPASIFDIVFKTLQSIFSFVK